MKKIPILLAVAVVGVAGSALAATYVTHYSTKGDAADGSIFNFDGCAYENIYIQAQQFSSQAGGGAPSSQDGAWAFIDREDFCTGEFEWGYGFVQSPIFTGHSVTSATLKGTMAVDLFGYQCGSGPPGGEGEGEGEGEGAIGEGEGEGAIGGNSFFCTYVDTPTTADIDLTWTGTGDTFRGTSQEGWTGTFGTVHERQSGSNRSATISGSMVINGVDLVAGAPYVSGQLYTSTSGSVDVFRY